LRDGREQEALSVAMEIEEDKTAIGLDVLQNKMFEQSRLARARLAQHSDVLRPTSVR